MSYNSKYKGKDVEEAIDKVAKLNVAAVDLGEEVEEPELDYVTKTELDNAIAQAITTTLNTEV
jgi:hypothetical protein